MAGLYNNNNDYMLKLQKGITSDKLFLYSKTNNLYIIKDNIRMFRVSFKRLVKSINLSLSEILSIIVKNSNNIYLETNDTNPNKFILIIQYLNIHYKIIFTYKIKLNEINNYLKIIDNENLNSIIYKQNEKINILLKKLEYYESKFKEPLTDEEFL